MELLILGAGRVAFKLYSTRSEYNEQYFVRNSRNPDYQNGTNFGGGGAKGLLG